MAGDMELSFSMVFEDNAPHNYLAAAPAADMHKYSSPEQSTSPHKVYTGEEYWDPKEIDPIYPSESPVPEGDILYMRRARDVHIVRRKSTITGDGVLNVRQTPPKDRVRATDVIIYRKPFSTTIQPIARFWRTTQLLVYQRCV